MESDLEKATDALWKACTFNNTGIHFALKTLDNMREHRCNPEVFDCMATMVEVTLNTLLSTNEKVLHELDSNGDNNSIEIAE